LSKVKVIEIKRKGFKELAPEALELLDQAIRDVVEGRVRPLEDLVKELKSSK